MLTGSGWKVFIKRGQGGGDLGVLGFWVSDASGWLLTRLVPQFLLSRWRFVTLFCFLVVVVLLITGNWEQMISEGHIGNVSAKRDKGRVELEASVPYSNFPASLSPQGSQPFRFFCFRSILTLELEVQSCLQRSKLIQR